MVKTIKERMEVVWNDDGTFRGAHINERIIYDDGGTRNTQRPLTEQEADDLLGTVESDLITQLTATNESVISLTNERDGAIEVIASLQSRVAELQKQIDELTAKPTTPTITARQGKLSLLRAGLLDSVKTAVAKADESVQIYWTESTEWHRDDKVLVGMATQLGLTNEQLDSLFAQAATL